MTSLRLLLCGCVSAIFLTSVAISQPNTSDKNLPYAGGAPPEELRVLASFVGQWRCKLEASPSIQDKEGYTATGHVIGQWVHNHRFIRLETATASSKYRTDFTLLYTYDARRKAYRRWLFSSTGLATEAEGQWDQDKRTMTWKTLNLPPNVAGAVTDVVADDRIDTTVFFKTADGRVVVDSKMVATREQ